MFSCFNPPPISTIVDETFHLMVVRLASILPNSISEQLSEFESAESIDDTELSLLWLANKGSSCGESGNFSCSGGGAASFAA